MKTERALSAPQFDRIKSGLQVRQRKSQLLLDRFRGQGDCPENFLHRLPIARKPDRDRNADRAIRKVVCGKPEKNFLILIADPSEGEIERDQRMKTALPQCGRGEELRIFQIVCQKRAVGIGAERLRRIGFQLLLRKLARADHDPRDKKRCQASHGEAGTERQKRKGCSWVSDQPSVRVEIKTGRSPGHRHVDGFSGFDGGVALRGPMGLFFVCPDNGGGAFPFARIGVDAQCGPGCGAVLRAAHAEGERPAVAQVLQIHVRRQRDLHGPAGGVENAERGIETLSSRVLIRLCACDKRRAEKQNQNPCFHESSFPDPGPSTGLSATVCPDEARLLR